MTIYVVKHETDIGPIFSSVEKAREWWMEGPEECEEDFQRALNGSHHYTSIIKVELDDSKWCIDS